MADAESTFLDKQSSYPEHGAETGLSLGRTDEEKIFVASQAQLVWWKFRKHKLAIVGGVVIILLYTMALFCEFLAPYIPQTFHVQWRLTPPTRIYIRSQDGGWTRPYIFGTIHTKDLETLRDIYEPDYAVTYPIRLFVRGEPYRFWGLFDTDLHLVGIDATRETQGLFLLGTDRMGRDVFSRIAYGARLSLSIGLVGIAISFMLGILFGGISGYYGGVVDNIIQRLIEFIRCMPTLPLWMSLSAALPGNWSIIRTYFAIGIILSLVGWTGLARVIRGRFLSMREEDFVMAARLVGAAELRIILRHMLPSFWSHIIASLSLSIPGMILGETGLSFIGLGLRPPAISWGVLLQDAQQVSVLANAPWLLIPGVFVIVTVIVFNFFGDGIRDAADPYSR
jgi:peptide/nickel transport system permease protein